MSLLSVRNLSYQYPKSSSWALSEVSLEVKEGSFFALLGPNGAGKTTLLRILCGRFPSFKGELEIHPNFRNGEGFLDSKKYGVLLENPGVYGKLSVEEYLSYFGGFYGMSSTQVKDRYQLLSKNLELPSTQVSMGTLSLGNRQKVQIVRAMLHSPRLLILDEPVANLDPISREMVWSMISQWRKAEGGTALVCSHVLAEMEQEATDYAIIDGGKLLKAGAVSAKDSSNSTIQMEFNSQVDADKVKEILAAAQLNPAAVKILNNTLSDIYRKTIGK